MKHTSDIHQKILEGARVAVAEAVETHRRLGQSIVVMRDGNPTWIAAEDIAPLKENSRRVAEDAEDAEDAEKI